MRPEFVNSLCLVYMFLCALNITIYFSNPSWDDEWQFWFGPIYTTTSFLIAVGMKIQGHTALCALYTFYTIVGAYGWWNNDRHKRKRRKLIDRAAGRVRDIGGRLRVVRPSET